MGDIPMWIGLYWALGAFLTGCAIGGRWWRCGRKEDQ
jgi:hypothetical protein